MQDAWRAYLELAMGLTEAPRKKAQDAVRRLVGSGGATAAQLQGLAEELLSTGAANREALTKLVRFEVDRALGAVGLATADEVAELTRRVHELERQLREAKGGPSGPVPQAPAPAPAPATAAPGGPMPGAEAPGAAEPAAPAKAVAKKAVAKKAVAKKAVAKKAVVKKPPATVTPAQDEAGQAEPARPVKKAPPRKQQPGGAE
ncbi:phasin family protein [Micromonospora echinaurantiaca]|uniref:phasin family protein n=1 Tax=Micromonospora echinaurantiaca TaxID=47857 RepID=UPI00343EDE88